MPNNNGENMKEYIDIKDKNGNTKKVEVVFRFHNEKLDNYYLVYKHNNEYFALKYKDELGENIIDTNLSKEELSELVELLNNIPEADL